MIDKLRLPLRRPEDQARHPYIPVGHDDPNPTTWAIKRNWGKRRDQRSAAEIDQPSNLIGRGTDISRGLQQIAFVGSEG